MWVALAWGKRHETVQEMVINSTVAEWRRVAREQDQELSIGSAGRTNHRKVDSAERVVRSVRLGTRRRILIRRLGAIATVRLQRTEQFKRTLGTELIDPVDCSSSHRLLA